MRQVVNRSVRVPGVPRANVDTRAEIRAAALELTSGNDAEGVARYLEAVLGV